MEFYLIHGVDAVEGVPPGSFATMLKLHHAAVDGVAGNELVTALMQSSPDEPPPVAETAWTPEHPPSYLNRLIYGGFQTVARPVAAYRQFVRAALATPTAVRLAARPPRGTVRAAGEASRFNTAISAHRVWDAVRFHLADIKAIKNSVEGATVNDAAVAIIGGAMRRYLHEKNELPQQTLSCIMPISVRPTTTQKPTAEQVSAGGGGNKFAMTVVAMRTDIHDSVERIRAVHEATDAAKAYGTGAQTLMDASEALPGALIGTAQRAVSRLITRTGRIAGAHLIITNVPGPRKPMYFCGAEAVFISGMAPVVDGMGLIIGVGSYVDEFFICWTADRDQMPDTARFADCIRSEFETTRKATAG